MQRSILVGCIGLVSGALIILSTHRVWHQTDQPLFDDASVIQSEDSSGPPGKLSSADTHFPSLAQVGQAETEGRSGVFPDASRPSSESPVISATERNISASADSLGRVIPEPYLSMVKPRSMPERLTTQELYKGFLDDARDESWAYPMELGINQYIARRGGDFEAAFEFVECRSRYCTIAGVVYSGGQETVNEFMAEMTQSGWWEINGGASTVGTSSDSEYRFVSIFARSAEDANRKEPPKDKSTEKATQGSAKVAKS
jgi:hypothetical protein